MNKELMRDRQSITLEDIPGILVILTCRLRKYICCCSRQI